MENAPNETFNELMEAVRGRLASAGFVRQGKIFRIISRNNCGIIDFQRSSASSKQAILFTINLSVVCGDLMEGGLARNKKPLGIDAHIHERIGWLLPERSDKWWKIDESTDREDLIKEISDIVLEKAVPFIERYLDTNAIIDLWESGQSPGLTEVQRQRFLTKLKRSLVG